MEKIVVEKIPVTRLKEKLHFQVVIPENATLLLGVHVSTDKAMIQQPGLLKKTHRGIGIIKLFIADDNDCFFSQMFHADFAQPSWEYIGSIDYLSPTPTIWGEADKTYKPFPVQQLARATLLQGTIEDLVGFLSEIPQPYNVYLTLHFQIAHP